MTRISMKFLLGASSAAVIAAVSLAPAAQAQDYMQGQGQPGYMSTAPQAQPGMQPGLAPAPQPYGYAQPQNAYAPPQGTAAPADLQQMNARYPGPKLN
jgi:hypothetical protein